MPLKIDMDKSPKAQLEALRNRQKLITTSKWNELEKEAHDKAFTVAKVMSADVLQDIYDYVQSAVKEGWSYDTFKKKVRDGGLVERMQNAGWLKTATDKQIGARLQVIIDTNVKMAYGKGNYNRLMLVKDKKPYWIYHQVERKTKRAEHSIYNGRKFHCDDPIWNTIYPPSGFRCSCWVEAVAEPDGVESGSNIEINPDEHPISPLTAWKPDTLKYVEGIQKVLNDMLLKGQKGSKEDITKEDLDTANEVLIASEIMGGVQELIDKEDIYNKVRINKGRKNYLRHIRKKWNRYYNTRNEKTRNSLHWYMGDGYAQINKDTREGIYNEDYNNIVKGDLSFLLKTKPTVYRGEKFAPGTSEVEKRIKNILNGKCFNQFTSASFSPIQASIYAGMHEYKENDSIFLNINIEGDLKVGIGTKKEMEIIIPVGTKYRIERIKKYNVNSLVKYVVDITVLPN